MGLRSIKQIYESTYVRVCLCVCVITSHVYALQGTRERREARVFVSVCVWVNEGEKINVCVDLFEQKLITWGGCCCCCSCYCFRLHFVSLSLFLSHSHSVSIRTARASLASRNFTKRDDNAARRPPPTSCRIPESHPSTWHNCCCNWYFTKISAISKRLAFFCVLLLFIFFDFCFFYCTIISLWFCVATGIVPCTIFIQCTKKLSQMCAIKVSNSLTDP